MLDHYLPLYDIRSRHTVGVAATPEDVYPMARKLDLSGSWLIRGLFMARGLGRRTSLGDLEKMGFSPLVEDPPNGFALGVIGRFWKPSGQFVDYQPGSFREYDRPGTAKAAWSFELTESMTGTTLATETRVLCLDSESRRSFARYWRVIGPFSGLIREEALRIIKRNAETGPLAHPD